jgi:hypothetical protein
MRLGPLIALSLAGCSLYFGSSAPERGGPPDARPPGGGPPDGGHPGGGPPDGSLCDGGAPVPPDAGGSPPGSCGSPELHVIGVYETGSATGDASVAIDRPGDHILVLSAYVATNWHVRLAPGATVRAIELFGYDPQTVDLPGVPITRGSACGYCVSLQWRRVRYEPASRARRGAGQRGAHDVSWLLPCLELNAPRRRHRDIELRHGVRLPAVRAVRRVPRLGQVRVLHAVHAGVHRRPVHPP